MAVYTEVSFAQASTFLASLGLGTLQAMEGCAGGIENTNYFVTTDQGAYVLTLFERLSANQLPFYLHLMKHLALRGIPVPDPAANRDGDILHSLQGKPAVVVNRLRGKSEMQPSSAHCAQTGTMLARMHLAGKDFGMQQPNLRGLSWWNTTAPALVPHLNPEQLALLNSELAYQNHIATLPVYAGLPRGPIHADLFRDNVMFEGSTVPNGAVCLSGFFDFYFAGTDSWLFDLAVTLNDWCIGWETGALVQEKAVALVHAYSQIRPLLRQERELLPAMARGAALRFWISRLWDFYAPREASMLKAHDPAHFERVLRQRVQQPLTMTLLETSEEMTT